MLLIEPRYIWKGYANFIGWPSLMGYFPGPRLLAQLVGIVFSEFGNARFLGFADLGFREGVEPNLILAI